MGTDMVPETSVSSYNQLTRLIVREDFTEFSRRKNFKLYKEKYFRWQTNKTFTAQSLRGSIRSN
jgi:NADH:ubiquinone oxidoreductase subunit C